MASFMPGRPSGSGPSAFVESAEPSARCRKPEAGRLDYLLLEGGRGLSGGQRQQLLLARTLLRDPQILILDEPTAWLDDGMEKHIVEGMKQWLGQRTLIVATHRPAVLQLTDRVLFIDNGKIMRDGSKEEILRPPPRPATVKSREVA